MSTPSQPTPNLSAAPAQAASSGKDSRSLPQSDPPSLTIEQARALIKRPDPMSTAPKAEAVASSITGLPSASSKPTQVQERPKSPSAPVPAVQPDVAKPANNAPDCPKEHSLSKTVADRLGCPAALLLRYLDYVIARKGKEKDGRRWYRVNLDHLAERLPYLSRSGIDKALKTLTTGENAPLMVHHENSHGYDRTGNYAFREAQIGAESRAKLRYFRPKDAVELGIPAALLLHNLRHWAGRKNAPKDGWLTVKVKELAKLLPLTAKQIRDALKTLVEAKKIEPDPPAGKHRFWRYRLMEPKPETVTKVDMGVTKVEMAVTNVEMGVTKVDMRVTKVDNYNSYQSSLSASLPASLEQKTNYSVRPASPTAVSGCISLSKEHDTSSNIAGMKDEPLHALSPQDEALQNSSSGDDLSPDRPSEALKDNNSIPVPTNNSVRQEGSGVPPNLQPSQVADLASQGSSVSPSPGASLWPAFFEALLLQSSTEWSQLETQQKRQLEDVCRAELTTFLGKQTDEVLFRWSEIRDREALYMEFQPWVDRFEFAGLKNRNATALTLLHNAAMVRLVEVFIRFREVGTYLSGERYPYLFTVAIGRHIAPYRKALEDAHRSKFVAARQAEWDAGRNKHRSADEHLENDPIQSAAVKSKVVENAIHSRNLTGVLNAKHEIKKNLLVYNAGSLVMAKHFFNANPTATPAHLLAVMDRCAAYVADNPLEGQFDARFNIRKGTHLTSLLKELPSIVAAAELGDSVPAFQAVRADEIES